LGKWLRRSEVADGIETANPVLTVAVVETGPDAAADAVATVVAAMVVASPIKMIWMS
jgi:hypothetical protein